MLDRKLLCLDRSESPSHSSIVPILSRNSREALHLEDLWVVEKKLCWKLLCFQVPIWNRFPAGFFLSLHPTVSNRPRGPMDEASAYGAGDCRFESYQGHCLDTLLMTSRKEAIMSVIKLLCCSERETLSAVMLVKKLLCWWWWIFCR